MDTSTGEVERPVRVLIDAINDLPLDKLLLVSPDSEGVKNWIKLPMLLLAAVSAIFSGLSIAMLKMIGELFQSGDAVDHIFLTFFLVMLVLVFGFAQLHLLNQAIRLYD